MTARPSQLVALEARIAERFGRRHCVLVGSGTAALYCIFSSLRSRERGPYVAYPEITCETAVNASIFAGFEPVFVDVDPGDGNMSAKPPAGIPSAEIAAVVPTHIYGHLMDLGRLESAFDPDIPRVEDAAQAYGGSLQGRLAGAMGQAGIISFGEGKLIDCGAGGAILTDDGELAEASRNVARHLPLGRVEGDADRAAVMRSMMDARRGWREHRDRARLLQEQREILARHRNGYLWQISADAVARIDEDFGQIHKEAARRRALAEALDDLLTGVDRVRVIPRKGEAALWRYSFLVAEDLRDRVQADLRKAGIRAAKLFTPCSEKFAVTTDENTAASVFSAQVVNLEWPSGRSEREFLKSVGSVFQHQVA